MITPGTRPEIFEIQPPTRKLLLERPVHWGHQGLSEVTFYRTYSRRKSNGAYENWGDCVVRVIEGMFTILKTYARHSNIPWNEARGQKHASEAAQRMHSFQWTPPGRGLWMMGTDYVWQRGGMALNNCAFVSTDRLGESEEETLFPFKFLMDTAMLGVGPGFDTEGAGRIGIKGTEGEMTYRVPDTREGWVEAMALTLRGHLLGGPAVTLDVQDVRGPGLPLKGFGGTSSGPLPLLQGLRGIASILEAQRGRDLDSVTITDVMNLIGKIVVSGNIRRTAEISFGKPGDVAFANMKNWNEQPVATGNAPPDELKAECPEDYDLYATNQFTPATGISSAIKRKYADRPWAYKFGGWRWASNNSVMEKVGADYSCYNDPIGRAGEPGLAWLELMRSHGRMKDPADHRDYRVKGGNPCLEQSLESGEVCNLVELYPSHCNQSYWEFQRTLKFAFMYGKAVTLMGTHIPRTNEIVARNRRIGCSMSGIVDCVTQIGRTKFLQEWCDQGYDYTRYLDRKYSDWLGVRESIKRTSNKPSGTVSLVAGVFGPGAHNPKPEGYRTMRLAVDSPVVRALVNASYRVEPAVTDPTGTVVAYFPWLLPPGTKTDMDIGLWEQVKSAADLQYWWADNQVSYTATFTPEEAANGEIGRVLTAFDGQLKGISFLAKTVGAYQQMPFTAAPRAEVEAYAAQLKPIDWSVLTEVHEVDDNYCDGAACTVRA